MLTYLLCAVVFYSAVVPAAGQSASFPDENLYKTILLKLGKHEGDTVRPYECTRIFTLDVSACGISDITGLRHCTNLTSLDLSKNEIHDVRELSSLPNLLSLNLQHNKLRFISALSGLTLLSELRIGYNSIDELSPLKKCTKLEKLYIPHNAIKDVGPLSGLVNLKFLNLIGNKITNINPLGILRGLEYLGLSDNSIADISAVSGLSSLVCLEISSNMIKDISPLTMARNIEILDLHDNKVSNLYPLSSLVRLRRLRLNNNVISDIDFLAGLSRLTHLNCGHNKIVSIDKLQSCRKLTYLNLSRNRIKDIQALSSLEKLQVLDLSENRIKDIGPLEKLKNIGKGGTEHTVHLSLASNRISDLSPLVRNSHLGKGAVVNISNNPVTDRKASTGALQQKGVAVLSFYLKGERELGEGKSARFSAVETIGGAVLDVTAHCTWKVLRGDAYASFSSETSGLLVNTNETGQDRKVVIKAEDTRKGREKKAYALVLVKSSPVLKHIAINGVDTLREDSAFQYYAIAVWKGRKDENITEKAVWKVTGGSEYARLDEEKPGKLINTNTTGRTQNSTIECTYTYKGKKAKASRQIKVIDPPSILSITVTGPASIPRGTGGGAFTSVCRWNGKDDEDVTSRVTWSVSGTGKYARFDSKRPGYLIHANRTGKDQEITVTAVLARGKETWKAEKKVVLTDAPYVTAVSIIGPETVEEDGSATFRIKAEWKGKESEHPRKGITWSIIQGKQHCSLNPGSGVLTNRNTTGSPAETVIAAEYSGGGVTVKNSKKVMLGDSPFVREIVISGPSVVKEDGSARYSSTVKWAGKDDEEASPAIAWSVVQGIEYIKAETAPVLSVLNTNTTGKDRVAVIKAEYTGAEGKDISAQKKITVKDSPYISGVVIEGSDTVKDGGSVQYTGKVLWKGQPDREATDSMTWEVSRGAEWIKLDPQKAGRVININETGATQEAEIGILFLSGTDIHNASKTVEAVDAPFIVRIVIEGGADIQPGGSADFQVRAEFSDGSKEDRTGKARWNVVTGGDYAEFDPAHPGRLINRNRTGRNAETSIQASLDDSGKALQAEKTVSVESKPFISSIEVSGPAEIDEGASIQFSASAVWAGKEKEEITAKAEWSIETGGEYAGFEPELKGIIVNKNTSGTDQTVVIAVSYTEEGTAHTGKKTVLVKDNPFIERIYITGVSRVLENIHAGYRAIAVWKGKDEEDITDKTAWKVVKGGEWAEFDMLTPGKLFNRNTTGEPRDAVIRAEYTDGEAAQQAEKTVTMMDYPFIASIEIQGNESIPVSGSIDLKSIICRSDGAKEEKTGKTYWEVVQGKEYAEFDPEKPGRLVNRNRTGTPEDVAVMCSFETLTECAVARKTVSAESVPFISSLELTGPDTIEEEQNGRFVLKAVWAGREDEDVTAEAAWSVIEGKEHAAFDTDDKGLLVCTGTDTEDRTITIRAEYTAGETVKTAEKKVVLKGRREEKDEEGEEGEEEEEQEQPEQEEENAEDLPPLL